MREHFLSLRMKRSEEIGLARAQAGSVRIRV
uniref:Uncharacterized protein n=1 Tax=Nelumbo nucifera TaxID=4432 RepID=A0A822ZBU3_NELNU|nr:TPA_asm: hypothetical protein HUJ06_000607 [Nelumbo nucifera]